jgi:uncharacterized protein (TIGR03437 family)
VSKKRTVLAVAFGVFFFGRALPAQDANSFFDDSIVQDVWLDVDPNDWATLQKNYLTNDYYQATFTWNGISLNIGIRSHGNGSRSPIKPNLDLKFDKYVKKQTFLGQQLTIAKAGNQDASLMHESVSFQLFRKMGLPAPRLSHARLYLNGQFFGLYLMEEHVDETYTQRDLGESSGYLVQWQPVQVYNFDNLGPDGSSYANFFDLKTNQDEPDLQTFANFVQVINNANLNDADYIAAISKYIDPKLFLAHAATENVLAELDGMFGGVDGINNFYLYQYNASTFYQVLTWDKDLTFWDNARDIFYGTDINHVTARLLKIPEYRASYLASINKAIRLFGGTGGWADQEITREYALIRDDARNDPNKQCIQTGGSLAPCGAGEFEAEVQNIRNFVPQRNDWVTKELAIAGYQDIPTAPSIRNVNVTGPAGSAKLAPGSLITVTGDNLGDTQTGQTNPLPRALGKTFVAIDGVRAALMTTASGTVVAQVPYDIRIGPVEIDVSVDGALSNNVESQTVAVSPSLVGLTHPDGSGVNGASPVVPGEVLTIYATGLGPVTSTLTPGAVTPSKGLISTVYVANVAIDGTPLKVLFSGLTPGFVGLYQLNVLVPAQIPSSDKLTVSYGGVSAEVALHL